MNNDIVVRVVVGFSSSMEIRKLRACCRDLNGTVDNALVCVFSERFYFDWMDQSVTLPSGISSYWRLLDRMYDEPLSNNFAEVFQWACACGYTRFVNGCLNDISIAAREHVLSYRDSGGRTALHHACVRGRECVVSVLLHHGCDAWQQDKARGTPVFYTCWTGYHQVLEQLLSHTCNLPLEDVGDLIDAIVRNNYLTMKSRYETLQVLTKHVFIHLNKLHYLIASAAYPHDNYTLISIFTACMQDFIYALTNITRMPDFSDEEVVELIQSILKPLNNYTDLATFMRNAGNDDVPMAGTPIIEAAARVPLNDTPTLLEFLLNDCFSIFSVDQVLPDTKKSALYVACERGHLVSVKCLVKHRANISLVTSTNRNCLHAAVEHGHDEVIEFLCQEGICAVSDILHENSSGLSPFKLAENKGRTRMVVAMLRGYVAHVKLNKLLMSEELTKALSKYHHAVHFKTLLKRSK